MLDLRWIRENPDAFDSALRKRGAEPAAAAVLRLDEARRQAQTRFQDLQQRRKELSRAVGKAKSQGESADAAIEEVASIKGAIEREETAERDAAAELDTLLAAYPNVPVDGVPEGVDETDNVEIRRVGEPASLAFEPKDHVALGEALGGMDFARASKLSGARFVVLRGMLARLERALAQFMLDVHTNEFGYLEVSPPVLVREQALFGTGQLPKFADDLFRTTDDYWLIPTAEVPLTNLVAGDILEEADLPLRFTAHTGCFRSEAGSAGRDTRGMIRQHQFDKVELVSITSAEQAFDEHERMTGCAEAILQRLDLPYRVMLLSTGDMGFAARKTYDLEVWLPSQATYREISSCSVCGDFQARRMNARYRPAEGKGTRFVHTLNGSALAVGRTLIAVLENGQQEDGSIELPAVLVPYMGGRTRIEAGA